MRKETEQLVGAYSIAVYANTDKLNDPSGSGASPNEFSQEVTEDLTQKIQDHVTEQLAENFDSWDPSDLRCEVTPIS